MAATSVPEQPRSKTITPILGLIAGEGKLPAVLAQSAKERGYKLVCLALSEDAQARLTPHADLLHLTAPGQLGRNLHLLKEAGATEVVFIGKVPKLSLLRNIYKLDWVAIKELSKLPNFNDDTIQLSVGRFMETHGLRVLTQSEFLHHLFPDVGIIGSRQPSAAEYADIDFGLTVAKEVARLDIGQTVVVKDRMILAIEAIEGTDQAIRRGVSLASGPVVVVKVSKQGQDQRFDIPTAGMSTLQSMRATQPGGVLAVEARATMLVDKEEMITYANANGMSLVAV
jgi:DUF1009 family protein